MTEKMHRRRRKLVAVVIAVPLLVLALGSGDALAAGPAADPSEQEPELTRTKWCDSWKRVYIYGGRSFYVRHPYEVHSGSRNCNIDSISAIDDGDLRARRQLNLALRRCYGQAVHQDARFDSDAVQRAMTNMARMEGFSFPGQPFYNGNVREAMKWPVHRASDGAWVENLCSYSGG